MKASETIYLPGDAPLAQDSQSQTPLPAGEYIGTIVPRYDLEVGFAERDPLELLESNFLVFSSPDEAGGTRYDIQIEHPAFTANGLLAFLKEVAPYKGDGPISTEKHAVLDDWQLPETAAREAKLIEIERQRRANHVVPDDTPPMVPLFANLVSMHEKLGDNWTQFMLSREIFLDTLYGEGSFPFRYNDLYYCAKHKETNTVPQFDETGAIFDLADVQFKTFGDITQVLTLVGVEDAAARVHEAMRWASFGTPYAINSNTPVNPDYSFDSWDAGDFRSMIGELTSQYRTHSISAEERRKLIDLAYAVAYREVKTPGGTFMIRRDMVTHSLQDSYDNRKKAIQGPYEVETMEVTFTDKAGAAKNSTQTLRIPGSEVRLGTEVAMAPFISWTTQGRRRHFNIIRGINRHPLSHLDGVLGVLAVAYVSPGIRQAWPQHAAIVRGGQEQYMGPAQAPVQGLQHRKALLKSPLIKQAEKLAA